MEPKCPEDRLLTIFASSDSELIQSFTNFGALYFEDSGTFLNSSHELEQRSSQETNLELSKTSPESSPNSFARNQCWAFSKYWLKKASEKQILSIVRLRPRIKPKWLPRTKNRTEMLPRNDSWILSGRSDLELCQTFTNLETLHFKDSGTFLNSSHELEQRSSQEANVVNFRRPAQERVQNSFARSQCSAFSKYWFQKASEKQILVFSGSVQELSQNDSQEPRIE